MSLNREVKILQDIQILKIHHSKMLMQNLNGYLDNL